MLDLTEELGIRRNASWCAVLVLRGEAGVPLDLTGHVVDADIMDRETGAVLGTWNCAVIDPISGTIEMDLTKAATLALPAGRFAYDVQITAPDGNSFYCLEGKVGVYDTVSR